MFIQKDAKKVYSKKEVGDALVRPEKTEDDLASKRRAKQVRKSQHDGPDVLTPFGRFPTIRHYLAVATKAYLANEKEKRNSRPSSTRTKKLTLGAGTLPKLQVWYSCTGRTPPSRHNSRKLLELKPTAQASRLFPSVVGIE